MTWIISGLSMIGVGLNVMKNKWCFAIWGFTNLAWFLIDYQKGIYAQAVLFAFNFIMSLAGLFKWYIDEKKIKEGKLGKEKERT